MLTTQQPCSLLSATYILEKALGGISTKAFKSRPPREPIDGELHTLLQKIRWCCRIASSKGLALLRMCLYVKPLFKHSPCCLSLPCVNGCYLQEQNCDCRLRLHSCKEASIFITPTAYDPWQQHEELPFSNGLSRKANSLNSRRAQLLQEIQQSRICPHIVLLSDSLHSQGQNLQSGRIRFVRTALNSTGLLDFG